MWMEKFDPTDWPKLIELPGFTRAWAALGLSDGDLRALQSAILSGPERHPIIRGTGGLRKIRFTRPSEGRGKRGAYRACYACFLNNGIVVLAMVYGKNEQSDLTASQRRDIATALRAIGEQLRGEVR
jgi:phage-related protein